MVVTKAIVTYPEMGGKVKYAINMTVEATLPS